MTVLEGKSGGFFYVHRSLYDQAVILHDLYGAQPESLRVLIMGDTKQPASVYFFENAPEPINVLGFFMDLVSGDIPIESNLVETCGVIHVISMSVNMRRLLKVDSKLRQSIRFSLSIKNEYRLLWDRFFAEAQPFGQEVVRKYPVPTGGVYAPSKPEESEPVEDIAALEAEIWSSIENAMKAAEEGATEDTKEAKEEAAEENDKSGLNVLKNW
jgi:hypothetical protein